MEKKKKKVFISGPMRGIPDWNTPAFNEAEEAFRELGYDVFNPAWMKFGEGWNVNSIMAIDIAALAQCECIYMLPGWEKSEGATVEHTYAKRTGKEFLYFPTIRSTGEEITEALMNPEKFTEMKGAVMTHERKIYHSPDLH